MAHYPDITSLAEAYDKYVEGFQYFDPALREFINNVVDDLWQIRIAETPESDEVVVTKGDNLTYHTSYMYGEGFEFKKAD